LGRDSKLYLREKEFERKYLVIHERGRAEMPRCEEFVSFSLHKDILDLKAKLSEKESELLRMECSSIPPTSSLPPGSGPESTTSTGSVTSEAEEWQAKYERLVDAHKRLQRNNICLEEKLLKIVDKFESDKNVISRELATQTQKVVEAKLTIQQLHKLNSQLKSDLQVALNLLQTKPSSFVPQRLDTLPEDLQARVRQVGSEKEERRGAFRNGGHRITIAMPSGSQAGDEAVSAAILAKVLEEREKERKKEQKFCIDIGTQTHGWHFPDATELLQQARSRKLLSLQPDFALLEQLGIGYMQDLERKDLYGGRDFLETGVEETDYEESEEEKVGGGKLESYCNSRELGKRRCNLLYNQDEGRRGILGGMEEDSKGRHSHVSNILLASLIHSPPADPSGWEEDDWNSEASSLRAWRKKKCDDGDLRDRVSCDEGFRQSRCDEEGRIVGCDVISGRPGASCEEGGRRIVRYEAEGRKDKVEKETNTVEHEGSELDSLAGVSSLKEDLVRDSAMDDHSSEMLIDVGQGFLDQSHDNRLENPDLKKDSSIQSQNADDDSRSGLCWWEQSIHSVSDTPTRKLMEVSIQNSCKPPAPNSEEKAQDNFEESVDNFQPSTSDLAALASPVLPTSSLHSSSLSSIFSLTQKATTPTITSNAFFKRSLSNSSWTYSARETDM